MEQASRIVEATPLHRHREACLEGILKAVVRRLRIHAGHTVLREEAVAGSVGRADPADHITGDAVHRLVRQHRAIRPVGLR